MTQIVLGGHYRFMHRNVEHIGIFHHLINNNSSALVDLYEIINTPANAISAEKISLIGLPDVRLKEANSEFEHRLPHHYHS
jgi:hypothetical protein